MKYSIAKTPAERAAAYRARKKERGVSAKGGRSGKGGKNSKWDTGQFIALDGEGASVGEYENFEVGNDGKKYRAKKHFYTLLAASTGESLYNGGKRLASQCCVDFLCDLGDTYKKGIFVIFAGNYDVNHMLMFGFTRETLQRLARGEKGSYKEKNVDYEIEYRARKSLIIRRGLNFSQRDDGSFFKKWDTTITIWDVFGFFQESFIGVTKKWLGENHRHYELIKKMKQLRGDFANVPQSEINAYNAAELETLVEIMDKVRAAVDGLGLKCSRWDGAGAVAAAIFKKHAVKELKEKTPEHVLETVRTAYAGGRIEICKIGTHHGPVYDYDKNSAYPDVMKDLPCMKHGHWQLIKRNQQNHINNGFTIVHCRFDFPAEQAFYPLFYRTEKMQISFPQKGEGWYWYPEYKAAADQWGDCIEVIEWYTWFPTCNHKPFHWIPDYYKTRQQWVKNPTEDWQKGAEKIIKLGLNSLYGKTAQRVGGRNGEPPAYHQMEWAGYITAATRARLYTAACLDPTAIIGFATDGIFSTRELPITLSRTKEIGAWELKEPVPVGITIAMAGVYWWHDVNGGFTHYSRGFDKDSMKTPELIINGWKKGQKKIEIPMHRLIGMSSACASDTLWTMRGRFTEGVRELCLDGGSHKRWSINVKQAKPHMQLVDLDVAINLEYDLQGCSFPYPALGHDNFDNDLELQQETSDTENI